MCYLHLISSITPCLLQGARLGDSVLGVTTPGRFEYSGGVYYYNDLTSTEPVTTVSRELELGLTRAPSVRAAIDLAIDFPEFDPHNVPKVTETLYGKYLLVWRLLWVRWTQRFPALIIYTAKLEYFTTLIFHVCQFPLHIHVIFFYYSLLI